MTGAFAAREYIVTPLTSLQDDEPPTPIGSIRLSADGRLSVLAAAPGYQDELARAVADINSLPTLFLEQAAPSDAAPFESYTREVARTDKAFPQSLEDYAAEYLDWNFASEQGLDAAAGPTEHAADESDLDELDRLMGDDSK